MISTVSHGCHPTQEQSYLTLRKIGIHGVPMKFTPGILGQPQITIDATISSSHTLEAFLYLSIIISMHNIARSLRILPFMRPID